jgi:hypothetical protein
MMVILVESRFDKLTHCIKARTYFCFKLYICIIGFGVT